MAAPRLRMDKSKAFSTIHGERGPGDPHANVHFYQDGLPFGAQGYYVDGILNDENDEDGKLRALAKRRLEKLAAVKPAVAEAGAETDDDDDDDDDTVAGGGDTSGDDDVNLISWAMGEQDYLFGKVRETIKKRLGVNTSNTKAAIEAMIDEKLITEEQLSPAFKKILG